MIDIRDAKAATSEELALLDRWWRAANYLSVGQIYLLDNPLLAEPLDASHVKPRLLGHWGTTPGLNFVYAHLNRLIRARDLNMLFVAGPGHGGPAVVASSWLDGTYSEIYPDVTADARGMGRLFRQFSFPGGIPSHASAETPGSINEGGELGYSLAHAYGAVFDNPDLIAACVIGDGEAETGALAASWQSNKLLDPVHDGAVLPILHLNGYKIANPSVLARIPDAELTKLLEGYGHTVYRVEGDDPVLMHQQMAETMDVMCDQIADIQATARQGRPGGRPSWPMLVLRSPKGWTGPAEVDGVAVEGTWRSHQVPLAAVRTNPEHLAQLERWLRSYRPDELFDSAGRLAADIAALAPAGIRRMSANPHANGGALLTDLEMPSWRDYAVPVPAPGTSSTEPTRTLGLMLRDVMRLSAEARNFRIFGPDETESNRLGAVYEATGKAWQAEASPWDNHLAPDGRVMEVLSEHLCQGWLEGYLLTGRHGLFSCYEAFIHIVDSMFNQHAKWLKVTRGLEWRRSVASLNYLLTSHVWRQDNNGFSHQDPGFIDHVVNKKAEVVRVYLPPDTNTLLSTADHCLRSRNYVNVIVAGKQPSLDWLGPEAAALHCARGLGVWEWASSGGDDEPDVVLACAGDVPTLETLAAVDLIRRHLPDLAVRVINVVDLMRLQPPSEHPHGLADADFDALFTAERPVIFAYHGYPSLIHHLTYRRTNHENIHVRGYKEEGTTTTPFDMVMLNDLDRFHLVMDVIDRVPGLASRATAVRQEMVNQRARAPVLDPRARRGPARDRGVDLARLMRVLTVNAGSSTLKAALVTAADHVEASFDIDPWDGSTQPPGLAAWLAELGGVDAVGHRVVHGGDRFTAAVRIDGDVLDGIAGLTSLAPLHQPRAVAAVEAVRSVLPGVAGVACFDTAFHASMPEAAATYALPAAWRKRWPLKRFGFHGLSHAWASRRAAELVGRPVEELRTVSCHLGAGASLCAVLGGRSVDTTMGFTPLEGLVMATRAGSVDPGLVLWLVQKGDLAMAEVAHGLERDAGLVGLAGGSGDMREVVAGVERGDPISSLALAVYVHRLRREIAAMVAGLGGLDALVFTGGVGEHQPTVRHAAVNGLGFLGVAIDPGGNATASGDSDISGSGSTGRTIVVTSREDLEIARQVRQVLT